MTAWVHHCSWCGWSRDASSSTLLAPHCDNCGGLLEALPAGAVAGAGQSPFRASSVPQLSPAFGRLARFALVGLLMFAGARFGWNVGGVPLALAAIGVTGLFTVPLIVGE